MKTDAWPECSRQHIWTTPQLTQCFYPPPNLQALSSSPDVGLLRVSSLALSRRVLSWKLPSIPHSLACTHSPVHIPPLSVAIAPLPSCLTARLPPWNSSSAARLFIPSFMYIYQNHENTPDNGIIPCLFFPLPPTLNCPINKHYHSVSPLPPLSIPLCLLLTHVYILPNSIINQGRGGE